MKAKGRVTGLRAKGKTNVRSSGSRASSRTVRGTGAMSGTGISPNRTSPVGVRIGGNTGRRKK